MIVGSAWPAWVDESTQGLRRERGMTRGPDRMTMLEVAPANR
jgi:hypothetical protein